MTTDNEQAQELVKRCLQLRASGENEAVLRAEFVAHLRSIFIGPGDDSWISHYSRGTEARTVVGQAGGGVANRFIDNLIGSTTIEYEADLRLGPKFNEGHYQVKEHAAGLVRSGVPVSQVRGILSDTVEWYAYDVTLAVGIQPETCTAEDLTLELVDSIVLGGADLFTAGRLCGFIRRHLAREQSRPLRSEFLTYDLGLESPAYERRIQPLIELVEAGRATDSSILLATDLWSQFVDYLEGVPGRFRTAAYVDEIYLCLLARLLSANVLNGQAIASSEVELKTILDGSYFLNKYQLHNMVEQDYFAWLTDQQHVDRVLPIAQGMQQDLYAYDFSWRPELDLFGHLMAQLAGKSQRKLLGQEWTPSWLAHLLAERCVDSLPSQQEPRIVDMCCGSGSILAEVIKTVRDRFQMRDISSLYGVATGFDIDPLAVSLAKATWVATLASEINSADRPIVIPIYHADSLFAVSPVSKAIPLYGTSGVIDVSLDGTVIELPNAIVEPQYSELFERIVDWAHTEALHARQSGNAQQITRPIAEEFLKGTAAAIGVSMSAELEESLSGAVHSLANRMAALAINDRDGIWAFILRNAYRPGLLTGQFNGLVSNPPWLAMSRLAENPYRSMLRGRAQVYDIQPTAQSFLHLELAMTHLMHAVDRYLKPEASIACLVPGTVFNGNHHEAFRQRKFLHSERPVVLDIKEMWRVAPGTFKYPGAAVIAEKGTVGSVVGLSQIKGFIASEGRLEEVDFSERRIGADRTAWVLEREGTPAATYNSDPLPQQGADLMPRTTVTIDILDSNGPEYRVDTPSRDSPWGFTVRAAKELQEERFPGYVAPAFIYQMAQSENLLPFVFGEHVAPIALPATRDGQGAWTLLDDIEIVRMGFAHTARRFREIDTRLKEVGQGKPLRARVNERQKLTKQIFPSHGQLVVVGAGGKYTCAACISLAEVSDLVVDQTLYWKVLSNPAEAWYLVGILNSHAMTEAIAPFNPKGAFGERHIHALPYRLMPPYDPAIDEHTRISELAQHVSRIVREMVAGDVYLANPSSPLHVRRSKVRAQLGTHQEYRELEHLCSVVLGTTAIDASGGNETR